MILQYKIVSFVKEDKLQDDTQTKYKDKFIKFVVNPNHFNISSANKHIPASSIDVRNIAKDFKKGCMSEYKLEEEFESFLHASLTQVYDAKTYDLKIPFKQIYAKIVPRIKYRGTSVFANTENAAELESLIKKGVSDIEFQEGKYDVNNIIPVGISSKNTESPINEFAYRGRFHMDDGEWPSDTYRELTVTFPDNNSKQSCLQYSILGKLIFNPKMKDVSNINKCLRRSGEKVFHEYSNLRECLEELNRIFFRIYVEGKENTVLRHLEPGFLFSSPGEVEHRSPPNPTCKDRFLISIVLKKKDAVKSKVD
ncbi:MAG: hypothetical protein HRT90_05580 [Candidatus Margulisbacteria bacterium]|nr:hypothetical protein [Candidatus Margulisiibacteriota bacterium]